MSLLHSQVYRLAPRVHGVPLMLAALVLCVDSLQQPSLGDLRKAAAAATAAATSAATVEEDHPPEVGAVTKEEDGGAGGLLERSSATAAQQLEVAPALFNALSVVHGGGVEDTSARLAAMEAALRPAFEVQRTVAGRVPPDVARGLAFSYFEREHGWLIKGLEPSGSHQLHEVSVLRKAPIVVQALVEVQNKYLGYSLGDLSAATAAIERLLLDESVVLLEAAYDLNGQDEMDWMSKEALHEVLQSYLLIFRQGSKASLVDAAKHKELKARAQGSGRSWSELISFENKSVASFAKLADEPQGQPDSARQYNFEDAAQIARDIALRYGRWQNAECAAMSADLSKIDADGTGRVPLSAFHGVQRNAEFGYQFTESAEYLRTHSSLEELSGQEPQVLIANYIIGPSNCIGTSQYLSVCCLNTCEALTNHIFKKVREPTVEPERLAAIVGIARASPEDSRVEPLRQFARTKLVKELHDMAAKQEGGKVELTTPEFRTWLHHAFPERCPAPPASSPPPDVQTGPELPSAPIVPPSHRPNAEDCTRMPMYFL